MNVWIGDSVSVLCREYYNVRPGMPTTRSHSHGPQENEVVENPNDTGRESIETENLSREQEPEENSLQILRNVFRQELVRERAEIYQTLDKKLAENNEQFENRVKGHLNLIKEEIKVSEKPTFKAKGNEKHFSRAQRYLQFCLEVRTAICEGDSSTALASIDALAEALRSYQRDIKIADSYDAGWSLVDRFRGEDDEEAATLRKLNQKILEEREATKRKNESRSQSSKIARNETLEDRRILSNILQFMPKQGQGTSLNTQPATVQGQYSPKFEKDLLDRFNPATKK